VATILLAGQTTWELDRDDQGHREYKVTFRVQGDVLDGPAQVLLTPGLPTYGAWWVVDNDSDLWAWCRWSASVKPEVEGEPNEFWKVSFTFSTKPPDRDDRACAQVQVEDPLLEPPKINGSFVVYSEEATSDRFGQPIINSAFERLRGPQVEFDGNRPQVKIEMNVANLDFAFLSSMGNTVNDAPLWGMPPRCVKLSEIEWERRFYGVCYIYYTLHLTFDIRADSFDRDLLDEGTKVLSGHWDSVTGNYVLDPIGSGNAPNPNYQNPQHFIRFKDRLGNPIKGILNGAGLPAGVAIGTGTSSPVYYVNTLTVNTTKPPGGGWTLVLSQNISKDLDDWNNGDTYFPGMCVFYPVSTGQGFIDYQIYMCLVTNTATTPEGHPTQWLLLPPGADGGATLPQNAGIWKNGTSYTVGQYVSLQTATVEGFIHVEKYAEADFTQLGIPLTF